MTSSFIIAGLSLGLFSSFHCVGMCGPIAFALPYQSSSVTRQILSRLSYHFGRIATYTLMGILFGFLGRQFYLAGVQQWFSITLGALILILLVYYMFARKRLQPGWVLRLHSGLLNYMSNKLNNSGPMNFFLLGMANGLLPCGMVYLAIAGALSSNSISGAAAFMAAFGLGTLPMLLTLHWFGHMVGLQFRNQLKKISPFVIAGMGVLLILRGLNLGIPFISPVLESARTGAVSCH